MRDEIAHSFDLASASASAGAGASQGGVGREPGRAASFIPGAAAGFSAAFLARGIACRASEVLALGHGLCFAKSHLLAALLRFAGHPTGFCYARLSDDERPGRFTLHGFVGCFEPTRAAWVLLDPRGNRGGAGGLESVCRFDPPYSLAYAPDPARGESLLPFVYKRPAKRIVDFLERVPDSAAMRRNLPDSIG
ncbi:MAG: transglutaminase domain-containing protein [Deltaproteobacteria bacterium]|nr:transglutaminase domain-containing protein [Deltaproteobacteria bacterium]